MSGGSHNYIYNKIDQELVGQMEDIELDDLMKDISYLADGLEWYHSSDISKESYFAMVKEFKAKWFESPREERLKQYVNNKLDDVQSEIVSLIGADSAPHVNDKLDDIRSEIVSLIGADPASPKKKEANGMTNAQKLEKLGMYEVLVRISEATDICMIDMLQSNSHKCPPGQDCRKCIGEWLGKKEEKEVK